MSLQRLAIAFALCSPGIVASSAEAQTITIRIGHQSMCTDTYPAGVVIKGLHLLQKYLPHTGKYKGVTYRVVWRDYDSGAPITNMMLANKLDFGVMGDYPLVVNGAKFQQTRDARSILFSITAYNLDGAGNSIAVPISSPITSVKQLVGKDISVPIGSSAWGMLYEMAKQEGLKYSDFNVSNQTPMVGITAIAAKKIDAHADFCPMTEYMEYKGTGRMIYSGAQTKIPYLHGVVVTKAFAEKYPEIVVAYAKAVIAADQWIADNPCAASKQMSAWTMIPKEVLYLYYSRGGYLTPDPTIKAKWLDTLEYDHALLAKYANIPPLNMRKWVNPSYLQTAYKEMGLRYAKQVSMLSNPQSDTGMPPEIWVAGQGIKQYKTNEQMFNALGDLTRIGKRVDTTYVYDADSGLKMFGNSAWYVKDGSSIKAYLTKGEAIKEQKADGGTVLSFAQLQAAVRGAAGPALGSGISERVKS